MKKNGSGNRDSTRVKGVGESSCSIASFVARFSDWMFGYHHQKYSNPHGITPNKETRKSRKKV